MLYLTTFFLSWFQKIKKQCRRRLCETQTKILQHHPRRRCNSRASYDDTSCSVAIEASASDVHHFSIPADLGFISVESRYSPRRSLWPGFSVLQSVQGGTTMGEEPVNCGAALTELMLLSLTSELLHNNPKRGGVTGGGRYLLRLNRAQFQI